MDKTTRIFAHPHHNLTKEIKNQRMYVPYYLNNKALANPTCPPTLLDFIPN